MVTYVTKTAASKNGSRLFFEDRNDKKMPGNG